MKKAIITLSLSLLMVVAFGQAEVNIGLKAGLNSSTLDTDNVLANYESASSFHAGIYGLVKFASFGLQPEILYSPQKNEQVDASLGTIESELVYLDIPVMLKYYFPLGINLQVGPQFSVLTSAESVQGSTTTDIKDTFLGSNFSAAVGAGADLPFGLQANVRYLIGLSDINDSGTEDEITANTFQISIGYRLFSFGN